MGDAAEIRRELAERVASVYSREPGVAAVLFGGSAARGLADGFSDLELSIVWREPPTEEDRRRLVDAAGGDLVRLYERDPDEPGWSDAWQLGRRAGEPFTGVEIDMRHFLRDEIDAVVAAVVAGDPALDPQSLVAGLLHGHALHGGNLIGLWRDAATPYPDALRLAMVRRYAQVEGLWRIEAFAARGNPLLAHRVLVDALERILLTLLALNRVYFSGLKWLDPIAARLELAPAGFCERLVGCFPADGARSAAAAQSLAEEMYDLVAAELPGVDVERLRRILRYRRRQWDSEPPGA